MSKKVIATVICICAIFLLFARVDFWWWGTKIHPILLGWITIPMLYQFLIWVAGTGLVFWLCFSVWPKDKQ
jgi:hypothetical protein